ncbi:GIY-YIG nuclease family protein [Neptuniibacter sp. QD57_21]|uniref:GIY-YIG nuclease family protein n=1 Tax=Neptuniibacter sp. QD57_21 TaxID=3398213 RepID=UPI0039F499B4
MTSTRYAKSIRMFLLDADPNGRVICELSNWTGKAYRIPRSRVKDCVDRDELKTTAVYFLFGHPETPGEKPAVYVGETENLFERLKQHLEKEFWTEAVGFISKDENLNKAHIRYLEARLYEDAREARRYKLINSKIPTRSLISEADSAEMEEFIEYVKLLVGAIGFKPFESLRVDTFSPEQPAQIFSIQAARGAKAKGLRSNDGFTVLAGAKLATDPAPSFTKGFSKLRSELIETGMVSIENNCLVLTEDYLFNSPSAAAAVIMGRNANGMTEWKLTDGSTLKSIEQGND